MKLRTIIFGAAAVLAVCGTAFGSKAAGFGIWADVKVGTVCTLESTDQNSCSPYYTGPQCTITLATTVYPAWEYGTDCTVPLYQFVP